jgi:ATP-dependent exoDNAse (exonuclease V) beta subunit
VRNAQQAAAIAARGQVFVSAGAGTGKTTVLVERFVEAVTEGGLDVESLLVITYTERAAGELKGRIRGRLHELGRHDLARSLDGAWISTIHGFCMRLLKAHPFAAGLDPRFRVLDDSQGRVVRGEAFEAALNEFCAGDDPERLRLLSTYSAAGLRRMLTTVYETLRSAGRELELELGERTGLEERLAELAEAARCLAADPEASDAARAAAAEALGLAEEPPHADRLLDLGGLRARGERAASYEDARKAVEQAALDELALRDRELLQELLLGFAAAYAEAKDRESALDFEDLQLRARDLLRDEPAIREREQLRFRSIMVDEFQDTNRLQCELVDLLTGTDTERFFVGDEFQSIYGFRHADVQVFRERREQADTLARAPAETAPRAAGRTAARAAAAPPRGVRRAATRPPSEGPRRASRSRRPWSGRPPRPRARGPGPGRHAGRGRGPAAWPDATTGRAATPPASGGADGDQPLRGAGQDDVRRAAAGRGLRRPGHSARSVHCLLGHSARGVNHAARSNAAIRCRSGCLGCTARKRCESVDWSCCSTSEYH